MSNSAFTSPAHSNTNSTHNTNTFNESRWVIQIRKTLEEYEEDNNQIAVSIFSVPTTLMFTHPDAYTPQQVALGPYHHWRQELYEMERYKIAASRRTIKHLKCFKTFQEIVDQLQLLEPKIRACYHKYLNVSSETLTWMMAIDVSFLLEFLEVYARKEGEMVCRVSSIVASHLVDSAGRKSAHIAILRDVMMVENQIPMFLLRKMLEFEFGSCDIADDMLLSMLKGLSKELYPFKTPDELPKILILDSAHVLDFFYRLLMPKAFGASQITDTDEETFGSENIRDVGFVIDDESKNNVVKFLDLILNALTQLKIYPVRLFKVLINSKLSRLFLTMPWRMITSIPILSMLKEPIEKIFIRKDKEDENAANDNVIRPPLIEELTIPSVTTLHEAGVWFVPTDGGICSTSFDVKTRTLSLPRVNLDVNSSTIMRNMVAYETCSASGPLIFARYTEFMNGIIDTKEDAKLLREKGIILNRLKSDEEVANLWNGMSRSVKLTKDLKCHFSIRWWKM